MSSQQPIWSAAERFQQEQKSNRSRWRSLADNVRASTARRLKLDFIPLFVEDYYLLGKRETFERADVEAIVASLKSEEFAAQVRGIPGYDTAQTGTISNVSDVIG